MQHSTDRDGLEAHIGAVFADGAFTALKERGAAFVVVRAGIAELVWANAAAASYWGASHPAELAAALFGPEGRGGWLEGIARGVVPGRAPRLARGGLAQGFSMRARTALLHAVTVPDGTVLLGVAVPESADPRSAGLGAGDPDAWLRPAWPTVPVDDAKPTGGGDPAAEAPGDPSVPDPGAGSDLARRSQIAVLRDRLNHAVDGAPTLRLLWRTDAADVVTQIDAVSFARLGSPLRLDRGTLPEAVAPFDPAAAQHLDAALATRATWSGITLGLPVADGAAVVPMALSASPMFGADRRFVGFRGFCTLDLGRLDLAARPAPVATAPEAVEPSRPAADLPGLVSEAVPAAAEAPVAVLPANVVQLRAFQAVAPGRFGGPPPAPSDAAPEPAPIAPPETPDGPAGAVDEPPAPEPQGPSSDDLAFLALGEALRARIGAEPRAVVLPEAPMPEPVEASAPPPETQRWEPLLDQLPLALLAMAGPVPVFANAAAAARLGYATPADLLARGDALAASSPRAGAITLQDAQGRAVPVTGRPTEVSLAGAPATLWILDEPLQVPSPPLPAPRGGEAEPDAGELLDSVDDAVALLDGDGRIRRLNRRGEGWFGREGAVGQSLTHLLAPESRPAALTLLGEVRGRHDGFGAAPLAREVTARAGEAGPLPMLLTLGRLGAGFYATLRDVTALRHAESERARSERDHARDAGRLPGLLAKVSHEVRTPLNAILGFAEVMMDERFGPLGNPRYRDYLKDIHASGIQVVTLIDDLLDLSRIEAGQLDLDVAAVDVNRIVAETVAQMQPEAHRERVIMRTSLGGRIPSVLADERSTRQIVRNLLSNAVKFNEPGGQVIVSTALSDSGTVLLRVRDTGVGMSDIEIAAALEPYGGLGSPNPANGNGNGLGLPLTRALVGANGASMAIRSRPREGTLVEVAFTSAHVADARLPA